MTIKEEQLIDQRRRALASWPPPHARSRDEEDLRKWVRYGDYSNVGKPWHSLIEEWEKKPQETPAKVYVCTRCSATPSDIEPMPNHMVGALATVRYEDGVVYVIPHFANCPALAQRTRNIRDMGYDEGYLEAQSNFSTE
jgi:hypothetical protein